MESRRTPLWVGAALLLVALNLRLPLAGVGPVLDDLRATLGLSNAAAGLLTTLPILCFGVAAAGAPAVVRRLLGAEGGLLACTWDHDRRHRDAPRAARSRRSSWARCCSARRSRCATCSSRS
ncbi:MAG: hypothetical protein U0S48_11285 [Solirubrobacteraceae bacterium]